MELISALQPELAFLRNRICSTTVTPSFPGLKDLVGNKLPSHGHSVCQWMYHVDEESCAARFEPKHMARAVGNLVPNAMRCARHRHPWGL